MDINSRIRIFLKDRKITVQSFETAIGKTNGYLSHTKSPTAGVLADITRVYPDLNMDWLVTGEGEMVKSKPIISQQVEGLISGLGISVEQFCESIGVTQSFILSMFKRNTEPSTRVIASILNAYPEISAEWLLLGEGDMKKKQSPVLYANPIEGAVPYYENLPVSAGQLDMVEGVEQPTGYVKIPGVSAKWLFPVIGCSMKPEINPGDIVGVNVVERWDRVDPDKVYMIITNEERMIKRLRIDNESSEVLWCISPNYPEFKIQKSDIKHIYQVVFHGELM